LILTGGRHSLFIAIPRDQQARGNGGDSQQTYTQRSNFRLQSGARVKERLRFL
jgi:hypothetical protein